MKKKTKPGKPGVLVFCLGLAFNLICLACMAHFLADRPNEEKKPDDSSLFLVFGFQEP